MQFAKSENTGQGQSQLYVGLFEGAIVGLNKTRKQLCEWRGWEYKADDEEIKYIGEDKDGNTRVTLDFCIEDVLTGKKFQQKLMITDKKSTSEKSGKVQYVNSLGMSTWVDDKKNLPQWFTHLMDKDKNPIAETDWREAYMGEADVYELMRNWLGKVNWFSPDTKVLLDIKKIFRGNVDEIRSLITADGDESLTGTVVFPATVYITEKDGEKKMYQNIAKFYMPGWKMKTVRVAASNDSWGADKMTKRFYEQVTGEYGVKDAYYMGLLKEFNENDHLQATDKVIQHDSTAAAPTDTEY